MIPSETGSLASERVSDARPTTSVGGDRRLAERLLDLRAPLPDRPLSHHSFVVEDLAGRRLAGPLERRRVDDRERLRRVERRELRR